jgi:hypothetical protein
LSGTFTPRCAALSKNKCNQPLADTAQSLLVSKYRPAYKLWLESRIRQHTKSRFNFVSSIYRDSASLRGRPYRVSSSAHIDTEADQLEPLPPHVRDDAKWVPVRKARPVNELLPATRRWLAMLAPDVQPRALVTQFPRLANRLAADWGSPEMCRSFLYQLLVDHRGNRKGFPEDVTRDILALRSLYSELHPAVEGIASTLDW